MNFQPYYTWNPKKVEELKIGYVRFFCSLFARTIHSYKQAMIKETVTLETEKEERAKLSKEAEKAAKLAAAERVCYIPHSVLPND